MVASGLCLVFLFQLECMTFVFHTLLCIFASFMQNFNITVTFLIIHCTITHIWIVFCLYRCSCVALAVMSCRFILSVSSKLFCSFWVVRGFVLCCVLEVGMAASIVAMFSSQLKLCEAPPHNPCSCVWTSSPCLCLCASSVWLVFFLFAVDYSVSFRFLDVFMRSNFTKKTAALYFRMWCLRDFSDRFSLWDNYYSPAPHNVRRAERNWTLVFSLILHV